MQKINKTEASHIKNICKELADKLHGDLAVNCYSNTMSLLGAGIEIQTVKGDEINFDSLKTALFSVCDLYSLSAFLGEEIKRLDAKANEIRNYNLDKYIAENNIEIPEVQTVVVYTEADAINEMSINDRAEFFGLEAQVAHIGKALHEGFANQIKKQIKIVKTTPCEVTGTGQDTVINNRELTIDEETFNKFYFNLQNQYRELQKKLNYLKSQIKDKVSACNSYRYDEYNKAAGERNIKFTQIYTELEQWKIKQLQALSNEQIAVPECYNAILNYINSLGK
jgi:hypothetical protein